MTNGNNERRISSNHTKGRWNGIENVNNPWWKGVATLLDTKRKKTRLKYNHTANLINSKS